MHCVMDPLRVLWPFYYMLPCKIIRMDRESIVVIDMYFVIIDSHFDIFPDKPCIKHFIHCVQTRETPLGPVRYKVAQGQGIRREKAEYEDLAALARREGLSLEEIREKIKNMEQRA